MYNYIKGVIEEKNLSNVVIDISGIGYEIQLNKRDLQSIFKGDEAKIYTYLYVREDEMSVYGFLNKNDKEIFLKLIDVSGIGVKSAIGILSSMNSNELIEALQKGDIAKISKCQGVGKKTAQRMILELQGKLVIEDSSNFEVISYATEAVSALEGLGFSSKDINTVLRSIENINDMDTAEIIKVALKRFGNA